MYAGKRRDRISTLLIGGASAGARTLILVSVRDLEGTNDINKRYTNELIDAIASGFSQLCFLQHDQSKLRTVAQCGRTCRGLADAGIV
jgi:hypothetical protein